MANPAATDLTDLGSFKAWGAVKSTGDDDLIQKAITGVSLYVLKRTGQDSLNTLQTYVGTYDGNGNDEIFLCNRPVVAIGSLSVNGTAIPASSGYTSAGYYVSPTKDAVRINGGAIGLPIVGPQLTPSPYRALAGPYVFPRGRGNVSIVYTAGNNGLPQDLELAVMKAVNTVYRRRDWVDLKSKALSPGGGVSGTTSYRDWMFDPETIAIFDSYRRVAAVSGGDNVLSVPLPPGAALGEVPQGQANGVNTIFTLQFSPAPPLSLILFVNGPFKTQNVDYTLAGNVITFNVAPPLGAVIVAYYSH